jgi:hypothetical protein
MKTQDEIIAAFKHYLEVNQIKPESKRGLEHQHAYLNGLSLAQELPPYIVICAQVGRSIVTGK